MNRDSLSCLFAITRSPVGFNKKLSPMTIYKTVKSLITKLFQWRHIWILLIILNRMWNRLLFWFDKVSAPSIESRILSILFSFQFSVSSCNCATHFDFSDGWICMRYHYLSSNTCSNICVCGQFFMCWWPGEVNTLRPKQNGRNFEVDIFKCIFCNGSAHIFCQNATEDCS